MTEKILKDNGLKESLLDILAKLFSGVKLSFDHLQNPENKVRIKDFKIVTKQVGPSYWTFEVIGPDNYLFPIQHPKLGFYSSTWHVKKYTKAVPWFLSDLPNFLFILAVQWWMKLIAYKTWTSTADKPLYYSQLLMSQE